MDLLPGFISLLPSLKPKLNNEAEQAGPFMCAIIFFLYCLCTETIQSTPGHYDKGLAS